MKPSVLLPICLALATPVMAAPAPTSSARTSPAPASSGPTSSAPTSSGPTSSGAQETIVLRPQPRTAIDRTARMVVADELARAAAGGDRPLVLVGEARLGKPRDQPALFIQLQSARECGSAGCSTSVYLMQGKAWTVVLDSVGGQIRADGARHGGMRDLVVGGDGRWVWDGHVYRDTRAAPNVDLTPKRP